MAQVSIVRQDGGTGPIKADQFFTLQASVKDGADATYQWNLGGQAISGATRSEYTTTARADTAGPYTVTATVGGQEVTSDPLSIDLVPADTTSGQQTPERPPDFHRLFAVVSALIAFGIAGIILWRPVS